MLKNLKKPGYIAGMRERLGLTQGYFAVMLNVSRTHLSLAEAGRRALPRTAEAMILQMYEDFAALETGGMLTYRSLETKLFINQEYRKVLPKMLERERWCRKKVKELHLELAKMKEQVTPAEHWIIVATRLIAAIPESSPNGKEKERVEFLKADAYDQLLKCWEPEQAKLHIRIEALSGEAKALRRYRSKVKKTMNADW